MLCWATCCPWVTFYSGGRCCDLLKSLNRTPGVTSAHVRVSVLLGPRCIQQSEPSWCKGNLRCCRQRLPWSGESLGSQSWRGNVVLGIFAVPSGGYGYCHTCAWLEDRLERKIKCKLLPHCCPSLLVLNGDAFLPSISEPAQTTLLEYREGFVLC